MIYIQILVRTALLMLSFFGYILFLSKYVKIELTPGLIFSSMGSLLFLAGLLNILRETAWCIFILGMLLLVHSLFVKKRIKTLLAPGIVFFAAAVIGFFFLLRGSVFENIDNFTHWAVAADVLLETDFFPDLERIVYRYPSYPLGSSCIIYYFAEIVGIQSEWVQMWAQASLMAGMISGLFAFAKRKRDCFAAVFASVVLLCSGVNFVDLLVDTLLPVTAIAAFCFCICYREELPEKICYILPYTVFLVCIKNSGILFAVAVLLYAFLSMEKNASDIKQWIKVFLLTVAVWYLWRKHVDAVFGVQITTHNMSLANYKSVIGSTTAAEKIQIIRLFLDRMISESKTMAFMLVNGALIWWLSGYEEKSRQIRKILIFAGVFYLVYQIGMLGMYLVSMPKDEAVELAGFNRYQQSVRIFSAGLLLIGMMLSGVRMGSMKKYRSAAVTVMLLAFFCVALQPNFHYYRKQSMEASPELQDRVRAEALMNAYGIPENQKYLILVSDDRENKEIDGPFRQVRLGYVWHLFEYLLDPAYITGQYASQVRPEELEEFDHVILFDETEAGRQLLIDAFGETEEDVICVYER